MASLLASLPEAPWLRVERLALVRREIRESLSASALELLWSRAETVVEGSAELRRHPGRRATDRDPERYYGRFYATIMVTVDLARCRELLRDPVDAASALRVAELLERRGDLRARLLRLVLGELASLCGARPEQLRLAEPTPVPVRARRRGDVQKDGRAGGRLTDAFEVQLEPKIRAEGTCILIDGDAVVSLESTGGGVLARRPLGEVQA
ncbi:MAG: hypothetical protein H6713_18070 [Myxococcales bacterium]|nr:hypothetical protein [Myxococcales bacterium]